MKLTPSTPDYRRANEEPPDATAALQTKVATALALLTFLIFLPVVTFEFINYDDDVFVTNNPKVAAGLTWEGIKWAFTSADIDYWRPLSWLSHMLDIELFGAVAGGHHLVNLLIHCATAAMLFLALNRLTQAVWPSAFVAALFAWHPLHVESVAWIAERKDVLCGFFWFFTVWAYARYVKTKSPRDYLMVFTGFLLGIMSKPMIITLPFALLLLDIWPLQRIVMPGPASWRSGRWRGELASAWSLLKEKTPFFLTIGWLALSTFMAQREVGAMDEQIPLGFRVCNALGAYATYLWQTVWPIDLCVLYPFDASSAAWGKWLAGAVTVATGSLFSLWQLRIRPFLFVGWFFFLGVLVPTIGLVQVGEQGHADRYTYVPLVGIFLAFVWGIWSVRGKLGSSWRVFTWVSLAILLACAVLTHRQLRHWENSTVVFQHALSINPTNVTALNNLASELIGQDRYHEAVPILERGLALSQRQGAVWNLGLSYCAIGDYRRAYPLIAASFASDPFSTHAKLTIAAMEAALVADPDQREVRRMMALASAARKDYASASEHLAHAVRLDPRDLDARIDLAAYRAATGKEGEALIDLQEVVRIAPANLLARSNLGGLLARQGRFEEALSQYRLVLAATPDNHVTRHNYATALARTGLPKEAKAQFEQVLQRRSTHLPSLQQLVWLLATNEDLRNGPEALRLAQQALGLTSSPSAPLLDAAAAAYAAAGRFDLASELAEKALAQARKDRLQFLEDPIRTRIRTYRSHQPHTTRSSSECPLEGS